MKIQSTITDYFPYKETTKQKKQQKLIVDFFRPKANQNYQKYPMQLCRYEPWIQKHVYVPPDYMEHCKGIHHPVFCKRCQLRPCITIGHHDEIYQFLDKNCREEHLSGGLNSINYFVTNNLMKKYFPLTRFYAGGTIKCVKRFSYRILLDWKEQLEKENEASFKQVMEEVKSGKRILSSFDNGIVVTVLKEQEVGEEGQEEMDKDGLPTLESEQHIENNKQTANEYQQDDQLWKFESILGHRMSKETSRKGCFDVLIKWVGYAEPTWEPMEVIKEDDPVSLAAYAEKCSLTHISGWE